MFLIKVLVYLSLDFRNRFHYIATPFINKITKMPLNLFLIIKLTFIITKLNLLINFKNETISKNQKINLITRFVLKFDT